MSQALLHFTIIPRECTTFLITFSPMSPHQFEFILPLAMCYIDPMFQTLVGAGDTGISSSPQGDEQMSKQAFSGQWGNSYNHSQNQELQWHLQGVLSPALGGKGPILSHSALPGEVNKLSSFLNMTFKLKPEERERSSILYGRYIVFNSQV